MDSVYAGKDLLTTLPSHLFPKEEMRKEDAYQAISDELLLDGNARQNLATFCQTWEEDEVHQLMDLSINKNMIDKDEYPQTAEIERRCVQMLADLWNAPDEGGAVGCSAIGSSEACMLGGMAALWRWRARRKAAGKPTDSPNFVCACVAAGAWSRCRRPDPSRWPRVWSCPTVTGRSPIPVRCVIWRRRWPKGLPRTVRRWPGDSTRRWWCSSTNRRCQRHWVDS